MLFWKSYIAILLAKLYSDYNSKQKSLYRLSILLKSPKRLILQSLFSTYSFGSLSLDYRCTGRTALDIIRVYCMTQLQHFNLFRKYRVLSKNDDDIFNIKYVLADDSKGLRKNDYDQSNEKEERSHSKEEKKAFRDNSREHQKKLIQPAYNKYKAHGSESGREGKPKPKQYKKKEWKEKIEVVKQNTVKVEEVEEVIGEKEETLKKQMNQIEKKMEKDQITKSNEQYELFEKLANDQEEDELDQDQEVDKLQPIPFISKRSKSSQFNEVFSEFDLARKSQLFIRDPRKLYDDFIDLQVIQQSRDNNQGIYYRGVTQFSDTVKWYCNIISNELEGSLVVEGKNTNRALHEDEVYFKIISQGKDKILCAVVAIIKRRLNQIVGKIQLNKTKQLYLLKPTNSKFAMMNINLLDINKEWLQNVYTKYFLAKFAYWEATDDHPYCKIISEYGNFGQVEIQTMALLKNYGIQNRDYSEKQLQEFLEPFSNNIDNSGQYIVPAQQLKKRKDFRKWRTFIVKDCEFDAAFSISPLNIRGKTDPNFLKKNIFQVNVHFVDVAYFIREKSALDEQAKKKQASYNLVYKVLSLLPAPLADTICNFRHNKDILTISVGFQIDEEGNILDTSKIAKSIICPAYVFGINEVQRIITAEVPFEEWRSWNCGCQMTSQYKAISADIRLINKVISKHRQSRIQNGALAFEIPIKSFKFDQNVAPTSFQLKAKNQANFMIQECVISASAKVGEYLFKNLKGKAILYRHRFPGFKRITKFKESLKKMGQSLPENSKQIQKFINQIILIGQAKQCIKDVIRYQTIKLLENFDYFQVLNTDPSVWIHYAINTPIYTHCSTPKRYYGDLLVQRQLASILQNQPIVTQQAEMKDLIEACNKGKTIAQNIRIGCEKLFLCLYLNKNPVFTNGVLTSIEQWGLKICIPKFNFKTMIKFKDLKSIKVTKFNTDQLRKSVKLDFTSQEDFKTKIVLKEMQEINLQIKSANTYPLDYAFSIVLPHPTLPEQKLVIF